MKTCFACKVDKPLDDFHNKKDSKDGKQRKCKACAIALTKKWQADNPDLHEANWKRQTDNRDYVAKRAAKYGLTKQELLNLLEKANGVCEICKQPPNRYLVVDHCHKSSQFRGILCEPCNQALGLFKDNIQSMQSAITYLGA